MNKKINCLAIATALSLAGAVARASAAVVTAISAADTPTVVNSIPVSGTGSSGYYIFGLLPGDVPSGGGYVNVSLPQTAGSSSQGGINGLPSWATVSFANAGNSFVHVADSSLTISGTAYTTLENFNTMTLTLGSGAPANFTLGLLANDSSDSTYNPTVSTPAASPTSTATIADEYQPNNLNDFYYYSVTGAQSGDTYQIGSTPGGGFGGITLDAAAVPEPASLALIGVGVLALLSRRGRLVPIR